MDLEKNSFLWTEARLVIAAVALFLGGVPVLYVAAPIPALFGLEHIVLVLAWIISGAASCYLLYGWNKHGRKIFDGKSTKDTTAFLIATVSGVNLGLAGLLGTNIGMTITMNRVVLSLVGLAYLWSAWHLWSRSNPHGKKLF